MIKVYEFKVTKDGETVAEGSVLSRREAKEVCAIHDRENGGGCTFDIHEAKCEMEVR